MEQETLHNIATLADKTTITAAAGSLLAHLTANDIAAYGGLVIAIIGLIVAIIFKWLERKDRLKHYKKIEAKRFSDLENRNKDE